MLVYKILLLASLLSIKAARADLIMTAECPAEMPPYPNLLQNPSFEDVTPRSGGTTGYNAKNWYQNGSQIKIAKDAADAHYSKYAQDGSMYIVLGPYTQAVPIEWYKPPAGTPISKGAYPHLFSFYAADARGIIDEWANFEQPTFGIWIQDDIHGQTQIGAVPIVGPSQQPGQGLPLNWKRYCVTIPAEYAGQYDVIGFNVYGNKLDDFRGRTGIYLDNLSLQAMSPEDDPVETVYSVREQTRMNYVEATSTSTSTSTPLTTTTPVSSVAVTTVTVSAKTKTTLPPLSTQTVTSTNQNCVNYNLFFPSNCFPSKLFHTVSATPAPANDLVARDVTTRTRTIVSTRTVYVPTTYVTYTSQTTLTLPLSTVTAPVSIVTDESSSTTTTSVSTSTVQAKAKVTQTVCRQEFAPKYTCLPNSYSVKQRDAHKLAYLNEWKGKATPDQPDLTVRKNGSPTKYYY